MIDGQGDVLADEPPQHLLGASDQSIEREHAWRDGLAPAECEKLLRQRGCAIRGVDDLLDIFAAWIGCHRVEQQLRVTPHGHQQIIEVVRDASGKAPDRFELLRLAQLVVALLRFLVPMAQAGRHRIEGLRRRRRFDASAQGHLAFPVAAGDIRGGLRKVPQRPAHAPAEHEAAGERDGQNAAARDQ